MRLRSPKDPRRPVQSPVDVDSLRDLKVAPILTMDREQSAVLAGIFAACTAPQVPQLCMWSLQAGYRARGRVWDPQLSDYVLIRIAPSRPGKIIVAAPVWGSYIKRCPAGQRILLAIDAGT